MAGKAGGEIMDISDTPDVALWVKDARRNPPGTVREPSKITSLSLHIKGDEFPVDPANEKEVAKTKGRTLTDESDYGKE